MLKANISDSIGVNCPACSSTVFVIYRRTPSQTSTIQNQCRCEDCGEHFEYEEDKTGNIIKVE